MLFQSNKSCLAMAQDGAGYHAAAITWTGNQPVVEQFIMQPGDLWSADNLKQLHKDFRPGRKAVTALLAAPEYQLLPQEAPNVPHREMLESVRWQVRDQLNFSAEDASMDVMRIPRGLNDHGRSVYAVAAAGELIRERTALIEQARFNLTTFDIPEMAQRNISALYEQQSEGLAMLSRDGKEYLLTITEDKELCMTRRIGAGVAARQSDWSALAREVERSLSYFSRHFGKPVSRMLLAVTEQDDLESALNAQLETAVEALHLEDIANISSAPELADATIAAQALPVIGAALRQEP